MNWQQACELPYYNGTDLGANYTPAATTFKLWAPTAAAVTVELFATGTDAEPNAHHLGAYHLQWERDGVWSLTLSGDWKNTYYLYHLQFHDGRTADAVDPYAHAAGANGHAQPWCWTWTPRPPRAGPRTNARLIPAPRPQRVGGARGGLLPPTRTQRRARRLTAASSWASYPVDGTTLDGDGVHPTCLNYLKRSGRQPRAAAAHFRLRDRGRSPAPTADYNWGYDPLELQCARGQLSPPTRSTARCACGSAAPWWPGAAPRRAGRGDGRGVQPHLPQRQQPGAHRARLLEPPLAQRTRLTNGSGCGCDLASERPMVRKYHRGFLILYWAQRPTTSTASALI